MRQISPWHPCIFIGKQRHKSQCSCIRTLLKKQHPTVSFWGGEIPFMCVYGKFSTRSTSNISHYAFDRFRSSLAPCLLPLWKVILA